MKVYKKFKQFWKWSTQFFLQWYLTYNQRQSEISNGKISRGCFPLPEIVIKPLQFKQLKKPPKNGVFFILKHQKKILIGLWMNNSLFFKNMKSKSSNFL